MKWDEVVSAWEPLGQRPPAGLLEARLQAHWAAQVVASFGITMLPAQPDDSHMSLAWIPDARLLAGDRADSGIRLGLSLERIALVKQGEPGAPIVEYALAGKTLDDAYRWLADLVRATRGGSSRSVRRPTWEMPHHPTGSGRAFDDGEAENLAELARWYANASRVLRAVAEENPDASPVRCWPHHFDMATIISFDPDEPDPDRARSIGVGLSPGDGSYAEPYWYVTSWPRPEVVQAPAVDGEGHWHTEDWFGAVLPGSRLTPGGSPREHAEQVGAFIASAMLAQRALLDL